MEIQSLCRCVALQIVIIIISSLYFQFRRIFLVLFSNYHPIMSTNIIIMISYSILTITHLGKITFPRLMTKM